MPTLDDISRFSTAPSPADFVSSDTVALASHMDRCASTRGKLFGLHLAMESAHSLIFPRMVTAAVIAVVLLGLAATV
ncbi:MAG: hypothetical protein V4614_05190 [Pseudomonadota bacterium]